MFVRILTITSNYTYVHVVLRNMVPSLGPIIMSMCESLLTQALRFARMSYLESWNIVVQSLQDGTSVPRPVPSQQRSMLSNPFLKFFEHLDMMDKVHRAHPLLHEMDLSKSICEDVTRIVSPLYGIVLAKLQGDLSLAQGSILSVPELERTIAQMYV
ncbi:hypothetical protein MGL_1300 [Malassezia globosa CBS 7966]|uniref:Exocyst complex subunit Exo70 C-terminal domain-containing protein n=1 Tax=Malassezia globosa (strain ATCC MYA-4612 / CBS 7966) TaxID=425265 RepID=A8PX24_MALGO|nr:uncharacterized protein MGL_1300 [Malassezia globosa CBS 7966]EDP44818.1 hypothetical protein MGL_1300 [Malassezia globosa CBS 7966]